MLPSIPVRVVKASEGSALSSHSVDSPVSLKELCAGKAGIIDLWHSKCVRCPLALEKLDDLAGKNTNSNILYLSLALSQGDRDLDVIQDLTCEYVFNIFAIILLEIPLNELLFIDHGRILPTFLLMLLIRMDSRLHGDILLFHFMFSSIKKEML